MHGDVVQRVEATVLEKVEPMRGYMHQLNTSQVQPHQLTEQVTRLPPHVHARLSHRSQGIFFFFSLPYSTSCWPQGRGRVRKRKRRKRDTETKRERNYKRQGRGQQQERFLLIKGLEMRGSAQYLRGSQVNCMFSCIKLNICMNKKSKRASARHYLIEKIWRWRCMFCRGSWITREVMGEWAHFHWQMSSVNVLSTV